ncbi:MAG: hypothetical protein AELANPGJ_03662 [Anaerolineae bacterium]|nr:hypothetical protein [Anaerolineae bacterium]
MPKSRGSLFAVAGGLMQIALAIGILFLPVFATCLPQGQDMVCNRQSYIQQGGSPVGYVFLALMIVAGIMALVSTRIDNAILARRLRWIAVLFTVGMAIVGAWGFGLLFVPGGVLLLLAAILSRKGTSEQTKAML